MDSGDFMSMEELRHAIEDGTRAEDTMDIDEMSVPPSPTFTESSTTTRVTPSELSLSVTSTIDSEVSKQKAKSGGSSLAVGLLNRSKSKSPFCVSESIYKLKRSIRNPITGEVTQVSAKHSLSKIPAVPEEPTPKVTREVGLGGECKIATSKARSESRTRRNPITGEGMEAASNPTNVKNYARSGIRVKQPPGGVSSGIF